MKTELDPIVSLTLLKSLLRPFAVAFTAALSLGIGEAKAEESTYSYEKSRLIVSGLAGSHVGGEGDLAIPLHLTNENVIAFNAIIYQYNTLYKTLEGGLFARQISPDGRHMYGANVYLGRQVSPNNHYSTRGTIGLEYGIDKVKFAINSYTFIGNKTTNLVDQGIQGGSVVGNNIVLDHQYAIEQIPTNGADISFSHQIDPKLKYLIGAFNFNNGIAGPKASVEYQVTAKTSVGLFAQYDDVRKGLAYVKLSYWLGAAESKPYVNSLLAPVAHDETSPARVVSPHTEKEIYEHNVYFVNAKGDLNASSGLNTPTAATTTVESISTLSKPGDFIIAAGNGSTLDLGNLTLQNAQTLQTRASNLIVNGVNVLPANTTQATTVSGTVTTQGAATINGINFINASTSTLNAITIAGADTVNLTNVNVSGYLGTGINVTGNSTVNLTTVTSNTNGVGLAASAG
ncbi:MAG: hypothetical protein EXR81_03505, partial [Gammaproteobacteria bacterium]|nr:hypothetical protein [Gammaproteobacteria bacterium]